MRYRVTIKRASLLLLFIFAAPQSVFAHATPITYTPASSETVTEVPSEVLILFTEHIEPDASDITVLGPDGSEVQTAKFSAKEEDIRLVGVPVRDAGVGQYTVSWQVVSSDDGHFTKGAYAFLVDPEGTLTLTAPQGGAEIQHITSLPEAGFGLVNLLGQAMIVGALVLLLFLWKPLLRSSCGTIFAPHHEEVRRRAIRFIVLGAFLTLVGTLGYLVLKSLSLQELRETDLVTAGTLFLGSTAGMYAFVRLLLGGLIIALSLIFGARLFLLEKRFGAVEILLLIITLGIMAAQSLVSHAAASQVVPTLAIVMTVIHLFFKEFLVGGVLALTVLLVPLRRSIGKAALIPFVAYSKIASVAVFFGGLSGVFVVWLHLKDPSNLFTSSWGERLILLVLFAGLFFMVRLFHQLYLEPQTLTCDQRKVSWFHATYLLEIFLAIVMLFYSGYISITTPPFVVEHYSYKQTFDSQGVALTIKPHPFESDSFLVTAEDEATGERIPLTDLIVSATNVSAGVGPIIAPVEQRSTGGYVFKQRALAPPGNWDVRIIAKRLHDYDISTTFSITYPDDIEQSRVPGEARSFGHFEIAMIIVALVVLVGSLYLFHRSKKLINFCYTSVAPDQEPLVCPTSVQWTPYIGIVAAVFFVTVLFQFGIKSDFRKACEVEGNVWQQGVAMREGIATSPNTATGCTLRYRPYHFTLKEEYDLFIRQSGSVDTEGMHIMPDGTVMLGDGKPLPKARVIGPGRVRLPNGSEVDVMDYR